VRWAWTILAIVVPCETALATDVPEDQKAFMEVIERFDRAYAAAEYHTLIDPEDPLFAKAVALKKSQRVQFSGSFFPNSTDCFREGSMTLGGSMDEPEFLFRFTDISPLP
jgi:hypothetical protein